MNDKTEDQSVNPQNGPSIDGEKLWLCWETQRRNEELARAFCCDYGHFDFSKDSSVLRYLKSIRETLRSFFSKNYQLVFAQCPSIVLVVLVSLIRMFKSFVLLIDAHNSAIEYAYSKNVFIRGAARFSFRRADFVIVSNELLSPLVSAAGGTPLVLADKVPEIPEQPLPARFESLPKPLITLIATYAADEPIEEFLQGASQSKSAFTLFITGSKKKAGPLLRFESEKIHFTDFLSFEDFDGLIQHSNLLVDLTTREHCLVCGAYEAVAVSVPALLSDSEALRETFPKGCLFAKNSANDYQRAIEEFLSNSEDYATQIRVLHREFPSFWQTQFEHIVSRVFERR